MKKYIASIVISVALVMIMCVSCKNKTNKIPIEKEQNHSYESIEHNDRLLSFSFRDTANYGMKIIFPDDSAKACILMLHGWNLPADEWCEETNFCDEALARGYILIIPDWQKCNYPLSVYPETMPEYRRYPDLQWIMDTIINDLQGKQRLLLKDHNNFVAGISTGGRGAGLLAFYRPEIFTGMASLSGDFDITSMQDEFLYQAWFGLYEKFPLRWKQECFAYNCSEYKVPSYVAHGKADKVSPVGQSMAMYDSLTKHHPGLGHKAHFPDSAGHDYEFWGSETEAVLDFFDGLCR